ncbi:MAG: hypothetical protein IJM37_02110 [Lachnospiraceae bacterium]|nr:hypothetical protein [Lachnospiraceae bacterium]
MNSRAAEIIGQVEADLLNKCLKISKKIRENLNKSLQYNVLYGNIFTLVQRTQAFLENNHACLFLTGADWR